MRRLRCCGRFCYWRLPIGPWQCTRCDRLFEGPMPKAAEPRFWRYIDELVARVERARRLPNRVSSPSWLWRDAVEGLVLEDEGGEL